MTDTAGSPRTFALLAAALSWFALALQLGLSIRMSLANGGSVGHGVWMYLAFFTILTNLLVAVTLSTPLAAPRSRAGAFFASPQTIAGVAVNIALVCVAYNLLLRHVWNPQGAQKLADELLHDVVPIVFVVHAWLRSRTDPHLFIARVRWAAWPLAYFAYALVRGAATDFYPYPFIDARTLGYERVWMNAVGILAGYFTLAIALELIGRLGSRSRARAG
jgi:hypothetical protein